MLRLGRRRVDLEAHLPKCRRSAGLYVDHDDFAFGPQVESVAALIVSGRFRDRRAYEAKRLRWAQALFPALDPTYAQRTRETILQLQARHVASS